MAQALGEVFCNCSKNPKMYLFSLIGKWFKDRKWTVSRWLFATGAIIFWGWLLFGSKLPDGKVAFIWISPALFAFFANILISIAEGVETLAETPPLRSSEAYDKAVKRLERVRLRKITTWKPINVDMLGVTFKNSRDWVENQLIPFMKKHPKYYFELRMVFVDKSYLEGLRLQDSDRMVESGRREAWVREFLWPACQQLDGRLRVHVRTINNIPHWHGILIERRYLYLGRVSWESDDSERGLMGPLSIICAETGYREFSSDDKKGGDDRVDLFRRWMAHYLYGGHSGRVLCDTNSPFYKKGPRIEPH